MRQHDHAGDGVSLESGVEKHLIRPGGSQRYVHCHIRVDPDETPAERPPLPLALALVIDRSGSMTGQKLATAKEAARAVVAQLRATDLVAVVVFDHEVEMLQPAAPVSAAVRERLERALAGLAARGNTALHQGWLTGCHAIAGEGARPEARPETLARCLLLTDGLANVGQTDPEQIATEAAGIREHAHVGTSTFGVGEDYDELLLGPLAVGGG
ncbi:MAG TPA: VWA domain-containing protein, partial [Thermomicrobiaceae bacterium]|nr:VWA domain-containing protein [Thermomicrobiaceae bacterium]